MHAFHATAAALIAVAACNLGRPAQADWGDAYHRWHPHDGWSRPSGAPALIVAPHQVEYAPRAAHDTPPPVAFAPSAAYGSPDPAIDFTVR
jgi:hypothetical protein